MCSLFAIVLAAKFSRWFCPFAKPGEVFGRSEIMCRVARFDVSAFAQLKQTPVIIGFVGLGSDQLQIELPGLERRN